MRIAPKNWAEFQHYKDRSPTWIKLHKALLDNYDFQCLPLASRALAPMFWLLASEDKDGVIDGDLKKFAFRLHTTVEDVRSALIPLLRNGFFKCLDDDSKALAEAEQAAIPEKRREEIQVQTETQERTLEAKASKGADAPTVEPLNKPSWWPKVDRYGRLVGEPSDKLAYDLGKFVFGPKGGGQITKMAKELDRNWRAICELCVQAAEKATPSEYLGAIVHTLEIGEPVRWPSNCYPQSEYRA